jgi:acyl dehydratase
MPNHYRGLKWDEFDLGQDFLSPARTVTEADTMLFAGLSGDYNPLHTDAAFAAGTDYGKPMAHGALLQSLMTGLMARTGIFEGTTLALRRLDAKFKNPVFFGDTVYVEFTVEEKKEIRGGNRGLVSLRAVMKNQDETIILEGWMTILCRKG